MKSPSDPEVIYSIHDHMTEKKDDIHDKLRLANKTQQSNDTHKTQTNDPQFLNSLKDINTRKKKHHGESQQFCLLPCGSKWSEAVKLAALGLV